MTELLAERSVDDTIEENMFMLYVYETFHFRALLCSLVMEIKRFSRQVAVLSLTRRDWNSVPVNQKVFNN